MNVHRVMAATKRVALVGLGAVAFVIVTWVAAATVGIEVGAGSLLRCFSVVFPACLAVDLASRRMAGARTAYELAAEGVTVAGGVTIMVWAGAEMTVGKIDHAAYILMFVSTFAVHVLGERRRERRARKTPASPHR